MNTKKIIGFSLIGVILAGIVFGGIFFFLVYSPSNNGNKTMVTYEYTLQDFTTNLGTVRNYFRGSIVIETTNKKMIDKFSLKNAEIRDGIIQILIAKKPEDILDTTGQQALRNEIKDAISKVMETDEITNVYFIDYIIQ